MLASMLVDCRSRSCQAVLAISDAALVKQCQDVLHAAGSVSLRAAIEPTGSKGKDLSPVANSRQDAASTEPFTSMQPQTASVDVMDMETQVLDVLPPDIATLAGTRHYTGTNTSSICTRRHLAETLPLPHVPAMSAAAFAADGHAENGSQSQIDVHVPQPQSSYLLQHFKATPSSLHETCSEAQGDIGSVAQGEQQMLTAPVDEPQRDLQKPSLLAEVPVPAAPSPGPAPQKAVSSMDSLLEAMLAGDLVLP